jgi:hypothetical protein
LQRAGVGDVALRRLRPQRDRAHPVGGVLRDVLLHERLLVPLDPDHRERAIGQHRDDPAGDGVEVVDELAFRRTGVSEERLVEVGQLDAVTRLGLGGGHPPIIALFGRPATP